MFGAVGASAPFLSLWLDGRGVSPPMIGAVIAAPAVAMVLTTVRIGRLLDTLAERRTGIVALNAAILALNAALLLAHGPWAILVLWTFAGILMHAMVPATDALALGVARRRGSDWARVRVFGSIGFVVAVIGGGALFERVGIELFLGVLVALSALRLLAATALPSSAAPSRPTARLPPAATTGAPVAKAPILPPAATTGDPVAKAPIPPAGPSRAPPAASVAALPTPSGDGALYRPGVLLTIAGAALINASHAFFYAFGLLAWARAGIGETLAGTLWSAGVLAEIALMWRFRAIAGRLSPRVCLLVAGGAGIVRWTLTAGEPPLPVLFAAQTLHALTFGLMFLATGHFIARRVAERDAARGQALSATFASGSMAAATWASGALYARFGSASYLAMGLLCALGVLLVATSYRCALEEPSGGTPNSMTDRSHRDNNRRGPP